MTNARGPVKGTGAKQDGGGGHKGLGSGGCPEGAGLTEVGSDHSRCTLERGGHQP